MKTPVELAEAGQVKQAYESLLTQEYPISALALSPEDLAKRGLYKAAFEAILAADEEMSPDDFVKALEGKLQIKDRQVKPSVSGDTIYVNFINLPKNLGRGGGGGAEGENNRMMFVVRFKDGKASIKQSVNALDRKYTLRAKTAPPAKIADYLATHLNKVVKEVEPKLTHSYEREKSAAEVVGCDGNCVCQGDCNPVALVEAGRVKEAYEAVLGARSPEIHREIGKLVKKREDTVKGLQDEVAKLRLLAKEWPQDPQKLIAFGIVTDAEIKSWLAPIEGFQKLIDQYKLQYHDMMLLDLAAKGKHKGVGGEDRFFALESDDLRRLGKLVKVVQDDMSKYREGFTPVEISPEGKKVIKLREQALKSPLFIDQYGYRADLGRGPLKWSA